MSLVSLSGLIRVAVTSMDYVDLTLPSPQENLACDEAFLDCREREGGAEILRVWEPLGHFVVLGYANRAASEVNLEACRRRGIPVLRRCSGGGTVLQGPGCLNYSLLLNVERRSVLQSITETNCSILKCNAAMASALLGRSAAIQGFTDLTIGNLKFSGNAQRRKRHWILFHGTFLLDFDTALMEELLLVPPKQPAYRQNRSHRQFLTRVDVSVHSIKAALRECWAATQLLQKIPSSLIAQLIREKYSRDEWNLKW